jgi:glycosyltransferase involved in cell wall biosynthesis
LKIALDATYSVGRHLSGVGVYSREILKGLAEAHPGTRFLACYRPHRLLRSFSEHMPANAHRTLLWEGRAPRAALFHGLNQRVASTRHKRTVSTFHDLFVMTSEYSTPEFRERFTQQARQAAERSDLIVAVSAFTARQVEGLLKVEPSRIRVIHHGVRPCRNPVPPAQRESLILFVGALQERKNIIGLVEAFERAAPGWKLVLAGSSGYGAERILEWIRSSPRAADIQTPGYVSDEALEELFSRASIFAFPSHDEGFGMPLLDAMARGLPVLTSNTSALPEVAGDAALQVDPKDVASIAEGLRRLVDSPELRTELAERGRRRSVDFSWKKAADATWEVYRELLG